MESQIITTLGPKDLAISSDLTRPHRNWLELGIGIILNFPVKPVNITYMGYLDPLEKDEIIPRQREDFFCPQGLLCLRLACRICGLRRLLRALFWKRRAT